MHLAAQHLALEALDITYFIWKQHQKCIYLKIRSWLYIADCTGLSLCRCVGSTLIKYMCVSEGGVEVRNKSGSDSAMLSRWRCRHTFQPDCGRRYFTSIYWVQWSSPGTFISAVAAAPEMSYSFHLRHLFIPGLFPQRLCSLWSEIKLLLHWGKPKQTFAAASV